MSAQPLAAAFRPQNLTEFVGHEHLLKPGAFLREAIKNDRVPSIIFWGPPGTGKTTLAYLIAKETKADFIKLSATSSGVKDLRVIIDKAGSNERLKIKTILFIDEIHRWNKAQQDALLPEVESGRLILIGATTENPSFELNSALISRAQVVVLNSLQTEDLKKILRQAIKKLGAKIKINDKTLGLIARFADGDARVALNILENARSQSATITSEIVKEIVDRPNLLYDKNGEEHYNIISALHKSIRGGDAIAGLYYLARMLEGGEDPLYVARRLLRFASEDIGLANNSALMLANNVFEACQKIGLPECKVHLAHLVVYLAKSPKSVAAYLAYEQIKEEVAKTGSLPVPLHIRNAPTKLMKDLGYSRGYKYTPLVDSSSQEYLPKELKDSPIRKIKL